MDKNVKLQTLKGFNDYFYTDATIRDYVRNVYKETVKLYGYEPLETPSLEYSELILGQSGAEAEKLYYRFKDNGDRDVMLRYELMTSMCRAVAQNINTLTFPYKRYQIQNVWRADNVQKGRYREFTQMDLDILGSNTTLADAEVIEIGLTFLKKLGFTNYVARINSRKILEGAVEYLQISKSSFEDVYIAIDKLEKIGKDNVKEILIEDGIEESKIDQLMEIIQINDLNKLEQTVGTTEVGKEGIEEVREILDILSNTELDKNTYKLDTTLARGLASYTGFVCELEVKDGNVGSVSGGGRYDKVISKYIGREIPAVGLSFGLERLTDIIKDRGMYTTNTPIAKVLLSCMDKQQLPYTLKTAQELRKNGISCYIYPNNAKIGNTIKYAEKKNIPWMIIIGEQEISQNVLQLKNLSKKEQNTLSLAQAIDILKK